MLGKTHMAVGIAATLACTCPKTVAELSMAVAIGTVGALIPDIDVESSESCRKANGAILLLSAISAAAAALDYFMGSKQNFSPFVSNYFMYPATYDLPKPCHIFPFPA